MDIHIDVLYIYIYIYGEVPFVELRGPREKKDGRTPCIFLWLGRTPTAWPIWRHIATMSLGKQWPCTTFMSKKKVQIFLCRAGEISTHLEHDLYVWFFRVRSTHLIMIQISLWIYTDQADYSWTGGLGKRGGWGRGAPLVSLWTPLDSLGLTWIHVNSLERTWSPLVLLGLTWSRWTPLDSFGIIRTPCYISGWDGDPLDDLSSDHVSRKTKTLANIQVTNKNPNIFTSHSRSIYAPRTWLVILVLQSSIYTPHKDPNDILNKYICIYIYMYIWGVLFVKVRWSSPKTLRTFQHLYVFFGTAGNLCLPLSPATQTKHVEFYIIKK